MACVDAEDLERILVVILCIDFVLISVKGMHVIEEALVVVWARVWDVCGNIRPAVATVAAGCIRVLRVFAAIGWAIRCAWAAIGC